MPEEQPITDHERDKQLALADLSHIGALKQSKAFNDYFLREPIAKVKEIERALLEDEMDEKKRVALQAERRVWKRMRDKLVDDETGNRSIAGLD